MSQSRQQTIEQLHHHAESSLATAIIHDIADFHPVSAELWKQLRETERFTYNTINFTLRRLHYADDLDGGVAWTRNFIEERVRSYWKRGGGITKAYLEENAPRRAHAKVIDWIERNGLEWCETREGWFLDKDHYGELVAKMKRGLRFLDREVAQLGERQMDNFERDVKTFNYTFHARTRTWCPKKNEEQ